jgi:predicted nicotinamide N-methyase
VHLERQRNPAVRVDATTIAGFPAALTAVGLPSADVRLYVVPDLEGLVDRGALLRGESEPPYWAYLWTGARVVAEYVARWVDVRGRRVLDLGCGLGLTGIVAARRGARVTLVDAAPPAVAFAAASLRANGLAGDALCADWRTLADDARFDVVLAAEVAYEPATFPDLAATVARHLAHEGVALVADGHRTETRALYRALAREGLVLRAVELRPAEEERPIPLRLTLASHRR